MSESLPVPDGLERDGVVLRRLRAVTAAGRMPERGPVAELRPLPGRALSAATLLARRRRLPDVDPAALRADLDRTLDASL